MLRDRVDLYIVTESYILSDNVNVHVQTELLIYSVTE